MNPEEINVAIAEHLGWRREPYGFVMPNGHISNCDFYRDLNAMHGALNNLSAGQYVSWVMMMEATHGTAVAMNATAAHRAEAFLRTVGKWKEDP